MAEKFDKLEKLLQHCESAITQINMLLEEKTREELQTLVVATLVAILEVCSLANKCDKEGRYSE